MKKVFLAFGAALLLASCTTVTKTATTMDVDNHLTSESDVDLVVSNSKITLDDGHEKRKILLNRPYQGLLIETGIWRTIDDFSSGAVCLVLASELYDESDYIYDYEEFLKYKGVL